METIRITVDGREVEVKEGIPLRKALISVGAYIPGLCDHPDLDAFKTFTWSEQVWQGAMVIHAQDGFDPSSHGDDNNEAPHCNLCLVSIDGGEPVRSCKTRVIAGMSLETNSSQVIAARQNSLKKILARHPHACLTCPQKHGCDRIQCSMNVPVAERCCELLGRCEIGAVSEWIGIPHDTPTYHTENRPLVKDEPLFLRNYELCINCARCVKVCRDVRQVDVLGAIHSGDSVIVGTQRGSSLEESLCRFCGACVEVCPTGALRDQPGAKQSIGGQSPCSAGCPLEIDVPGYIELIADGLEFEALELIREKAILPGVLGYACFHPCEASCRRGSLDAAASICSLKRYASDFAGDLPSNLSKNQPTGKRVAVIGGGPAGLAASADLLRLGHDVTLFDRDEKLGGMLRQTLPDFRLPDEVIDRDLKQIYALGLKTQMGTSFGEDFNLFSLQEEGFDASVIALGLGQAASLGVEGENLPQVMRWTSVLSSAACNQPMKLDGRVIVIGGGAVAVDSAMIALRSGASEVTMVCLESADEMPAHPEELNYALEEGVRILNGWGVSRFVEREGKLAIVSLKKCLSVFDAQKRFRPQYDEAVTTEIEADWAIVAIGQRAEIRRTDLEHQPGVFIIGDLATGPSSIVQAMASGKRGALDVDRYLGGSGKMPKGVYSTGQPGLGLDEDFHHRDRVTPQITPAIDRLNSMSPFIATINREQARAEASRCLRCHLRSTLTPAPFPPDPWQVFDTDLVSMIPASEGVIILADDQKKTTKISGAADMKSAIKDFLSDEITARYCRWECDPMFTKRESELLQAHLQSHGEMPGAGDLDDLF